MLATICNSFYIGDCNWSSNS